MSKKLYLLRHADALEKLSDQKDVERDLSSTGLQNATRMGINLSNEKVKFDIIITSQAQRAFNTSTLIAEQIQYDPARIHINEGIYEASVRTLLQVVNQFKEEWKTVLLVGHNPSISYLAEYLTKYDIGDLTTCGLVKMTFKVKKWELVTEGSATFQSYEYPDLLNF
jgi:phosphohistidine phosphatase